MDIKSCEINLQNSFSSSLQRTKNREGFICTLTIRERENDTINYIPRATRAGVWSRLSQNDTQLKITNSVAGKYRLIMKKPSSRFRVNSSESFAKIPEH